MNPDELSADEVAAILHEYYLAAEAYMVGQRIGRMSPRAIDRLTTAKARVRDVLGDTIGLRR